MVYDSGSAMATPEQRREELIGFYNVLKECPKCTLCETRTNVVFGMGDANADLMFVGEAPGLNEDQQAKPFVGAAGKLLDKLLAGIDLDRKQVFIANVLKCRPPENRDPQQEEIDACKGHLFKQMELIQPKVVCSLGNFSTKLLSGSPEGITKVHGQPQQCTLESWSGMLYPLFHPAAALYTPSVLDTLKEDFARLPRLIKDSGVELAEVIAGTPEVSGDTAAIISDQARDEDVEPSAPEKADQIGLF